DHLVHLYLDALNSDAADFLSHVGHGLTHAVAHPKFQLGNKARGTQHPQRVITERKLRGSRSVHDPSLQVLETCHRVKEFPGASGTQLDCPGVDFKVTANQVIVKRVAKRDLRVTAIPVIKISAEGSDFNLLALVHRRDRAKLNASIPRCLRPAVQDLMNNLRPGLSGEV